MFIHYVTACWCEIESPAGTGREWNHGGSSSGARSPPRHGRVGRVVRRRRRGAADPRSAIGDLARGRRGGHGRGQPRPVRRWPAARLDDGGGGHRCPRSRRCRDGRAEDRGGSAGPGGCRRRADRRGSGSDGAWAAGVRPAGRTVDAMGITIRDRIATVLVAAATLLAIGWFADVAGLRSIDLAWITVAVLALGVPPSAMAVVPGFW